MKQLYSDRLVLLSEIALMLKRYYFPFGSKSIALSEIDKVRILRPTLMNGQWRLWGTGNLKTWFPLDLHRPGRERVFLLDLKGQWRQIGFTVERWEEFVRRLRETNLPLEQHP
jgi:hypothetical protein